MTVRATAEPEIASETPRPAAAKQVSQRRLAVLRREPAARQGAKRVTCWPANSNLLSIPAFERLRHPRPTCGGSATRFRLA